jgi:hypothetical protein
MNTNRPAKLALLALLTAVLAPGAFAATLNSTVSGTFDDPNTWTPSQSPTNSDTVYIGNNTTVTLDDGQDYGDWAGSAFQVAVRNVDGNGTFNLTNGAIGNTDYLLVGNRSNFTGTLNLGDGGLGNDAKITAKRLLVGYDTDATGVVNVYAGGNLTLTGEGLRLGSSKNSTGTLNVHGGSVTISNADVGNAFNAQYTGVKGYMNVHGGNTTISQLRIGAGNGGSGYFYMDGGNVTVSTLVSVGYASNVTSAYAPIYGHGELHVAGGTLNAITTRVGAAEGTYGELRVSGGTYYATGITSLADGVNATASLTVEGNGFYRTTGTYVGNNTTDSSIAPASIIVNGSGNYTSTEQVNIAATAGSAGNITVNGGVFNANKATVIANFTDSAGNLVITGGRYEAGGAVQLAANGTSSDARASITISGDGVLNNTSGLFQFGKGVAAGSVSTLELFDHGELIVAGQFNMLNTGSGGATAFLTLRGDSRATINGPVYAGGAGASPEIRIADRAVLTTTAQLNLRSNASGGAKLVFEIADENFSGLFNSTGSLGTIGANINLTLDFSKFAATSDGSFSALVFTYLGSTNNTLEGVARAVFYGSSDASDLGLDNVSAVWEDITGGRGLRLTFDYTAAVPEPASVAVLLGAFTIAAACLRRRF